MAQVCLGFFSFMLFMFVLFFFFNDTATTEIYTLSLHDALPICAERAARELPVQPGIGRPGGARLLDAAPEVVGGVRAWFHRRRGGGWWPGFGGERLEQAGFRAELVVNRDAGHSGSFGNLSHARVGPVLGDQLACGGEDARARPVDLRLAPRPQPG